MRRGAMTFVGALLLALGAAAGTQLGSALAEPVVPPPQLDFGHPYLAGPMPDAAQLVPPPPAEGSARLARDLEANRVALMGRDGPRWQLAARDADLSRGAVGRAFSCSLGIAISDENTPALASLLRRVTSDFGLSTSKVKDQYMRTRPFMDTGTPTCTPQEEPALRANGSYPSGHSAIGFGAGLVLASLAPDHAASLVARGRAFGDSRYLCNVHWLSDVEEGRVIATATYARLVADPAYQADVAAAKAELSALHGKAPAPQGCHAEAAALSAAVR